MKTDYNLYEKPSLTIFSLSIEIALMKLMILQVNFVF